MAYLSAELRRFVMERAGHRCEYCLIPDTVSFAAFEVDHIISLKHGGITGESNLALSCAICNKYKGSDIASIDQETGNLVPLYHPRNDGWSEHFQLIDARIMPLTPVGRITVRLLQFNTMNRIEERRLMTVADVW